VFVGAGRRSSGPSAWGRARIGANAVVVHDVPPHATVWASRPGRENAHPAGRGRGVRLGLWLSCVYLFAVYFRPQELYPNLITIPNHMDILGGLAVAATLLDVLMGARPRLRQPQVWLLASSCCGPRSRSRRLALGWAGVDRVRALSVNVFVFFIVVLHGAE